jgi:hypothetical protein
VSTLFTIPRALQVKPGDRNCEVWGEDADKWRPERFLDIDKSKQTTVGVYANLCVFYVQYNFLSR